MARKKNKSINQCGQRQISAPFPAAHQRMNGSYINLFCVCMGPFSNMQMCIINTQSEAAAFFPCMSAQTDEKSQRFGMQQTHGKSCDKTVCTDPVLPQRNATWLQRWVITHYIYIFLTIFWIKLYFYCQISSNTAYFLLLLEDICEQEVVFYSVTLSNTLVTTSYFFLSIQCAFLFDFF